MGRDYAEYYPHLDGDGNVSNISDLQLSPMHHISFPPGILYSWQGRTYPVKRQLLPIPSTCCGHDSGNDNAGNDNGPGYYNRLRVSHCR